MVEALAFFSLQRWAFQAVAMTLTAVVIPGFKVTSIFGPFLAVLAIAFINAHVWSAALFFQLPDSITVQAGLLLLVNGAIFWILVKLLPGIEIKGVLPAIAAPVVFTVLTIFVEIYGKEIDWSVVLSSVLEFFGGLREYFSEVKPVAEELSR
ncbi:MAG: phage holin family protein [Bdellovibrionales bacterium]|nr:phage holin family protein [Bdellovibrionales bacterium]